MTSTNRHIIARQVLDLNLVAAENNVDLQQRLSKYFWAEITPVLEAVFDKYAGADEVIVLDKLEIDLGIIDLENLETEFVQKLKIQLEETLTKIIVVEATPGQKQAKKTRLFEQWLQFLATGTLSWAMGKFDKKEQQSVLDTLGVSWIATRQLQQLLSDNPRALTRLVYQHDEVFLKTIVELFTGKSQTELLTFRAQITQWLAILKQENSLLKVSLKQESNPQLLFWQTILERTVVQRNKENVELLKQHFLTFFLKEKPTNILIEIMATSILHAAHLTTVHPVLSTIFIEKNGQKAVQKLTKKVQSKIFELPVSKFKKQAKKAKDKIAPKDKIETIVGADNFEKEEQKNINKPVDIVDKKQQAKNELALSENSKKTSKKLKDQQEAVAQEEVLPQSETTIVEKTQPSTAANSAKNATRDDTVLAIKNGDNWYLNNAGIVILHVFLPTLFRNLGLVEKSVFKNETARQRAVHLIQYLATGLTGVPEYELVLAKLLCGMPFEIPIVRDIALTMDEKTACEELLLAAIKHWGALGNSSPDALREGFLNREGKLEKRQNGWALTIEKKTLDILMNRLSWNIGMVKLPWMKDILWVDWN